MYIQIFLIHSFLLYAASLLLVINVLVFQHMPLLVHYVNKNLNVKKSTFLNTNNYFNNLFNTIKNCINLEDIIMILCHSHIENQSLTVSFMPYIVNKQRN